MTTPEGRKAFVDAVAEMDRQHELGFLEDMRRQLDAALGEIKDMLAGEISKDEAVSVYHSGWWKGPGISDREAAIIQLYQRRLVMPIALFQHVLQEILDRPVYTHDLANREKLVAEYEGKRPPPRSPFHSFEEMNPDDDTEMLVVVTPDRVPDGTNGSARPDGARPEGKVPSSAGVPHHDADPRPVGEG